MKLRRTFSCSLPVGIALVGFVACGSKSPASPLIGEWRSGWIATEWGEGETRLTFGEREMTSVFVPKEGEPIRSSAAYRLNGDKIESEELNSGQPMRFEIRGDELVLYGADPQPQRMRRRR
ncbi:hypothetical protein PHYC_03472 [Phycisphaerales bacterium]|nr:hypothetical protein PHYC_03472 [Phycisphaerales bacterium]